MGSLDEVGHSPPPEKPPPLGLHSDTGVVLIPGCSAGAVRPLAPFKLERYFAKHEFSAPHLLCQSDCEPLLLSEMLLHADPGSLELWQNLRLAYTEPQGHPELRAEIAKQYDAVVPDDIVVLAPEEGIFLAMHAMLSDGEAMIVTFPGYASLYEVAGSRGCDVICWEPREDANGRLCFLVQDLADLMQAAKQMHRNVRLVAVNFPHNPTGETLSREDFNELVSLCDAHQIVLFSDEMYRGLELQPAHRLPSAVEVYNRAVVLGGVSKTMGLPGLRIGWLASKQRSFLHRVLELKDYTTICNSAPSEILALMALRRGKELVQRNVDRICRNLEIANRFFAARPDLFCWHPPLAGSVAFPSLKLDVDVEEWCDELVREAGILLLPASVYDHAPTIQGRRFRIGLGRDSFGSVIEKLGAHLDAKMPRQCGKE